MAFQHAVAGSVAVNEELPTDGLLGEDSFTTSEQWTRNEFGGAPLGDQRLSARLVKSVDLLASIPGQPITGNPNRDRAAVKGYYRLIEQPEESAVSPENILASHRSRTVQRMRDQDTVLCIQDGTDLSFATRPACRDLEVIGRNQTSAQTLGMHLHLTLATTGEGLPLGILRCGFNPPQEDATANTGDETKPATRSQRWIQGMQDVAATARQLTGRARVISVMDREADVFELFDEQRRNPRIDVLVRAKHDRVLNKGEPKLFATLRNAPPDGQITIEVERLSERRKSSRKKARPARSKRTVNAELHFASCTLPSTLPDVLPVTFQRSALISVMHLVYSVRYAGWFPPFCFADA